jgi:hypothetical protein
MGSNCKFTHLIVFLLIDDHQYSIFVQTCFWGCIALLMQKAGFVNFFVDLILWHVQCVHMLLQESTRVFTGCISRG